MEYQLSATIFTIMCIGLYFLLKSLIKENDNSLKKIEQNKRSNESIESAIREEKQQLLENEKLNSAFHIIENEKSSLYVKRSVVNLAKCMNKIVEETPSHIDLECNFVLDKINIKTSKYVNTFFQELINNSLANTSQKIQIRFEDLKKSYKVSYKDDRSTDSLIDQGLLNKLKMYDSEFSFSYKNGRNKFNLEIDLYFNKYNGKTKIGRFYTLNEIENSYGKEIVDSKVIPRNDVLRAINQTKDYALFYLRDNEFDIAKSVLKKRFSVLTGEGIAPDKIYRIFSIEYFRQMLSDNKTGNFIFQNRRNKEGKVTFVINYGDKYLQMSWPCPEFCADRINDILH